MKFAHTIPIRNTIIRRHVENYKDLVARDCSACLRLTKWNENGNRLIIVEIFFSPIFYFSFSDILKEVYLGLIARARRLSNESALITRGRVSLSYESVQILLPFFCSLACPLALDRALATLITEVQSMESTAARACRCNQIN